ncbi:hypothetical protein AB0M34_27955 [Nocardia sp. NPDC050193]
MGNHTAPPVVSAEDSTLDRVTAQKHRDPENTRIRPTRSRRRLGRTALVAVFCAAFSATPILVGTSAANASSLVPCTYGPIETRLEVDCHNNDFTPATVNITAWCNNFAYIGWRQRMDRQSHTHITRDCGPGAHPVLWWVSSKSDWEELQDSLDERD